MSMHWLRIAAQCFIYTDLPAPRCTVAIEDLGRVKMESHLGAQLQKGFSERSGVPQTLNHNIEEAIVGSCAILKSSHHRQAVHFLQTEVPPFAASHNDLVSLNCKQRGDRQI